MDLSPGKVVGTVEGLTRCHSIVLAPGGKTGFISDGGANAVVAFDAVTWPIWPTSPPDGMVYEPVTRTLWAFNGVSKNATVIDVDKRALVPISQTVDHPLCARGAF